MRHAMLAIGLIIFAADPATAATVLDSLKAMLPGSQLRLDTSLGWERRADVWELGKDGKVAGTYQKDRSVSGGATFTKRGRVEGRWWIEDGKLCVEGKGFELEGRNCYEFSEATRRRRRANEFNAVNQRNGQRWRVFVRQR